MGSLKVLKLLSDYVFFKLTTTSQRILQYFVISSHNIQCVREMLLPFYKQKWRHNPHKQPNSWIHYFQPCAIYFWMAIHYFIY